jgi:hypothetical protein
MPLEGPQHRNSYFPKSINSMELIPSRETYENSDAQEIPRPLWNTNAHYHVHIWS